MLPEITAPETMEIGVMWIFGSSATTRSGGQCTPIHSPSQPSSATATLITSRTPFTGTTHPVDSPYRTQCTFPQSPLSLALTPGPGSSQPGLPSSTPFPPKLGTMREPPSLHHLAVAPSPRQLICGWCHDDVPKRSNGRM